MEVADVRAGGSGLDEVAEHLEKSIRVVAFKSHLRLKPRRPGARNSRRVDERTGCVSRTVDAVRAYAGQHRRAANRFERAGAGETEFLIASALPISGHPHCRLAARNHTRRTPVPAAFATTARRCEGPATRASPTTASSTRITW